MPGSACARPARGWCAGARTSRATSGRRSPTSPTGAARSPAGARRPPAPVGRRGAALLIVGLAPAANGGNRTGRVFTGDSSGDWLFASLHRVGLATRERSEHAGDGQRLVGARMVATVRCAPPANKPTVAERDTCAPWINRELELLAPTLRVVVALGAYGWDGALRALAGAGLRRTAGRSRGSATAPEVVAGPRRSRGAPARLLPPVAAQHLHRPAHPGDARRGLRHRPRPRRHPGPLTPCDNPDQVRQPAPVSQPAEEAALKAVQSGFDPQRGHHARGQGDIPSRGGSRSRRGSTSRRTSAPCRR